MKSFVGSEDLLPGVGPKVEDPFYVCDLGFVVSQFYRWKRMLPRVVPFYAVKCNPDLAVIKTLLKLGCNFDCASRNEINLVLESAKQLGLNEPPQIIFANPCKPPAHIVEAVCKGVKMVTFDNVEEVKKCAAISKKIELVLRIVTDDTGSQCRLSSKFGAPRSRWIPLLSAAKEHGLQVVGVSFHVGSGCRDPTRYDLALRDAKELFQLAEKDYSFKMRILDIGHGTLKLLLTTLSMNNWMMCLMMRMRR
jgi:ornithine decarboxylase